MTLNQIEKLLNRFIKDCERLENMDSSRGNPRCHKAVPEGCLTLLVSESKLRNALDEYRSTHRHPGARFHELEFQFHEELDDVPGMSRSLESWAATKQKPVRPVILLCGMHFQGLISSEQFHRNLAEGLKRDASDPWLLFMAYEAAKKDGRKGECLHYAVKLAVESRVADHHILYGIECGLSLMPERAEQAFRKALELDPESYKALNGLGRCRLEELEVGEAEDFFSRSMELQSTEFAKRNLKAIERLRNARAWTDEEKRLRKFWSQWETDELDRISGDGRQKMMAEVVAGRG